jgi:diguanylate cyclase (GGDEF)-like protein
MISLRAASFRTKLRAGVGVALSLIVLVGGAGLYDLHTLNRSADQIAKVWLPRIELLGEIKAEMAEYGMLAWSRLQSDTPNSNISGRMESIAGKLRRDWRLYEDIPGDAEEALLYSVLRNVWGEYEADLARAISGARAGETPARDLAQMATTGAALSHALLRIDDLITYARRQTDVGAQKIGRSYVTALWLTIGAIALAVLALLGAVHWFRRNVSLPIRRVSEAMRQLNAGDTAVAIPVEHRHNDEIGALIEAANGYRESLVHGRKLAAEAERERQRFVSAVNNMPIGLVIFDAEEKLIFASAHYTEIYRLPAELAKPGTPMSAIAEHRNRTGQYPGDDPGEYAAFVAEIASRGTSHRDVLRFRDGRTISLFFQPMAGGGWIATHEDITDRQRTEAQVAHLTHHDGLTDLPNRILLRERLDNALARTGRSSQLAVLHLDLDNFKELNDTLGHPIGDALLVAVAKRLESLVREDDTVARLGGDEFAIVQVGAEQPQGAKTLAERVAEVICEPYQLEMHRVLSSVSIGIALAPSDGRSADELLKAADMALYRAKSDGRGVYRFFEREMDAQIQARRTLELDLRRAIEEQQFELFYQPLFNLETNTISGFEALLRWFHPARGMISPAEFIPLAEECGLIVPIGEWVLKRACHDATKLPSPVSVAVNLSPAQFRNAGLMQSVVSALASSELAAGRLELEITESALLANSEATLTILHQLRAMGVRMSMDDFGTGYSSLSYLQSFPFDKIKIDQRFISDVNTDSSSLAIVRAVIGLGVNLGIVTTAEGIETREQFDRVKAEGCTEVQGYLTGRPMTLSDARALLQAPGRKASAA